MRPPRLFAILAAAIATAVPMQAAEQPPPDDVQVTVVLDTTVINGVRLQMPMDLGRLIEVLGDPDRMTKGKPDQNTLHTWDELGMLAYESPNGKIISLAVCFGREDKDFWPRKYFRGLLRVDGATVTGRTSIGEINRGKEGKKFERSKYLTDNFTLRNKTSSLFIQEATGGDLKFTSFHVCEKLGDD